MGSRQKTPWKLVSRPDQETLSVHFSHAGQRYRESTGSRDPATAATEAARIYAEVVSGRRERKASRQKHSRVAGHTLDVLCAEWLASLDGTHDKTTIAGYLMYVKAHWLPFFRTLDRMTTASCGDYARTRLRSVQAKTVRKEQSALRGFFAWCVEHGHLLEEDAPVVKPLPKRATGTPNDKRRKVGGWIGLTADEAEKIIAKLPEEGKRGRPIRAYYVVLWETGLRPETLCSLRAPLDYKRGSEVLRIRDEADKARYGRELPLTEAARAALDSVCPEAGSLFPRRKDGQPADYRVSLRAAAAAAGLDADRAGRISDYDFRHGRITHLVHRSGDLLGPGYLVGHKHVSTTAIYAHARKDMGERALAKAREGRGG